MTEGTPVWFGPEDRPLFGWVHAPATGRSDGAVVLCPPLARELTSAHFAYRLLARALARSGLTAVRFDYDGTGDSAGDDAEPGRVDAWLASVDEAVALARRTGAETVALVGMRLGALLALHAARRTPVAAAVLWDPCPSGRRFLKEQRSMYLVQYGAGGQHAGGQHAGGQHAGGQHAGGPAGLGAPPGPVDLPGYRYSAETARELSDLAPPPPGVPSPCRLLVLTRRGQRPAADLALGVPADQVEWDEIDGQEELLNVEPLRQQLPTATVERITRWLRAATPAASRPVEVPERTEVVLSGPGGRSVVERAVRLGALGLFGIETVPTGRERRGPTVLLLTSGNDWHAGPNRLWVALSRRWAEEGVRSIRFDASGIGDSPVRPGQAEHVVRAPEAFDDVAMAAAAAEPDDPGNVVLLGLCSGGYQALESALRLRPRAALSVNPVLRVVPPEAAGGAVDPRRRIHLSVGTFGRAVRRGGPAPLRRLLRSAGWRVANRFRGQRGPAAWLGALVADGVDVLCICGEDEGRQLLEGGRRSIDRLAASGRLRIDVVPGLDHALMPFEQRQAVAEALTGYVLAPPGRLSPSAPSGRLSPSSPAGRLSPSSPAGRLSPSSPANRQPMEAGR
jgi:alpha-beta hydrolase superfamily lysophospholipase